MWSGSDYADILPKMMRPRQEFPTPLFKVVAPLALAAIVALAVYLATA
jgi:hypothetical protein